MTIPADARTIRVAIADLNGQPRGKRMPAGYADKLGAGSVRMPLSALNVDIWGADIEDSPLVFETGDADGTCHPTERGAVPMPWLATPSALVPMTMMSGGVPFAGDPRAALARVLDRYAARGWRVMAATELEFYLIDDSGKRLRPPRSPLTGARLRGNAILSIRTLDAFDAFFTDLYDGAEAMGIPAQAAISESGIGQFEVNLLHDEAMRAADDAWLFKQLVKGVARAHGMVASFMAKPWSSEPGNGLHVHFSVLDAEGRNVFDNGGAEGTPLLRHAIAGCLEALPGSSLILAPHLNSYDRLTPGSHAPVNASWGYENRTVALRVPGGPPAARRIEHRVAGGDINPYLLLAAILGAALSGIEAERPAPDPVQGNAYDLAGTQPGMAADWATAIELFATSPQIAAIFEPLLIENLVRTKRQEQAKLAALAPEYRMAPYLETV